jgi:hypothetical protein
MVGEKEELLWKGGYRGTVVSILRDSKKAGKPASNIVLIYMLNILQHH